MAPEFPTSAGPSGFHSYRFPSGPTSPQSPGNVNSFDAAAASFVSGKTPGRGDASFSSIMIRRLPAGISQESLRSMLIFAKDCIQVELVAQKLPEDKGYSTAIASFRSPNGAEEARDLLHGRNPQTSTEMPMIVEVVARSPGGSIQRRNPLEGRDLGSPDAGPLGSAAGMNHRASSKFNSTFQALDRVSPPRLPSFGNGDAAARADAAYHARFAPQSPRGGPGPPVSARERPRVSGKSVIDADAVDDDTGQLLKDPLAYAQQENLANQGRRLHDDESVAPEASHHHHHQPMPNPTRRSTMPHIPTTRFASLTLSNPAPAPPPGTAGLVSPRGGAGSGPLQSPSAFGPAGQPPPPLPPPPFSPPGGPASGPAYPLPSPHYAPPTPHTFPPVNPADQNPPCNTLYVGNLPLDTAEDELKGLFSKQRGYRRLCFRTKGNGPMCFVEFDDVSLATKALKELYGWPLSNSVKGGIRLSFSKNPLGVRTGQSTGPGGGGGSSGLPSPMTPHSTGGGMGSPGLNGGLNGVGGMPGMNGGGVGGNAAGGGMPGGFATASGPPPGIPAPPGFLINTRHANATAALHGGPLASGPLSAPLSGGFGALVAPGSVAGAGAGAGAGAAARTPSVSLGAWGAATGGGAYHDSLVGR